MMKNEVMEMKEFTDELVSEEEVKEIMTGAGYYAWTAIQEHMCNPEGCRFHRFMEAVWALNLFCDELAYSMICIMLQEAGEDKFLELLEDVCPEDEFAKRCFIDAFNEAFKEVLEEQGMQTDKIDCNQFSNGFEPEEEGDETPVMEISIKMNDSFIPEMQKQMNDFFQMLGIPFPDLLKECEDDE